MGGTIQTLDIDRAGPTAFRRTLALLLPVFVLAALMIMIADRADASTASAGAAVAAASVSAGGESAVAGAQINIRALICGILFALRAGFGSFFGFIFDRLIVAFGCTANPSGVPNPGGGDDDDNDD
jgi:hypothetical protein